MSHGKRLLLVEKWYIMIPCKLLLHHSPVAGVYIHGVIDNGKDIIKEVESQQVYVSSTS